MTIADDSGRAGGADGTGESLSPSLRAGGVRRSWSAYEIKFLLDEAAASEVQARLAGSLRVDPYCGHAPGGSYRITSLACDSAAFGVFFRDEAMRNRKYRVRRYGAESVVYLERKRSRQGKVRKRRCTAGLAELEGVVQGGGGDAGHAWFTRELRALELGPVCRVTYLRRALYGETGEGPVRVTFDREIDGVLCPAWSVEAGGEARRVLEGRVVCEFKFENAMPSVLKQVVAAMRLEAVGVSKYRACVRAFAPELGVDLSREVAAVNGAGVVPVASVGAGVGVADA